jgi:hypothetical protein
MKNGLTSTTSSRDLVYMPEQREVVPSPQSAPHPQALDRPKRRRFSQDYTHRIVQEAAACAEPGQVGAQPRPRQPIATRETNNVRPRCMCVSLDRG